MRHLSAAIAAAALFGTGLLASCDDNDKSPDGGPPRSTSSTSVTVPTPASTSIVTNGPVP